MANPNTSAWELGDARAAGEALFVVDAAGRVVMCGSGVQGPAGRPWRQVCGRPLTNLLLEPVGWPELRARAEASGPQTVTLRGADLADAVFRAEVHPLRTAGRPHFWVRLVPLDVARRREENDDLVRALFAQRQVGLSIRDMDLRVTRLNITPASLGPPSEAGAAMHPVGRGIEEVLVPEDAAAVRARLEGVAATGEPLMDWVHRARLRHSPERERVLSFQAFRLHDARGTPSGVAVIFTEVTEQQLARQRMTMLQAAAERIGSTLDVTREAEELAGVMVSTGFADLAAVDLTHGVLRGAEPQGLRLETVVRRVAVASAHGPWPAQVHPRGADFRLGTPESDHVRSARAVYKADLSDWFRDFADDPEHARLFLPPAAVSYLVAPLVARERPLGALVMWRTSRNALFGRSDADLAQEIASRAALALDNARRYTRERKTAEALQRSLLPKGVKETSAADTVGHYIPAASAQDIGGTWFDVIPLSSSRTAFVVGDVSGRGLAAAATMGRLRTAIHTLTDLDLGPGELLTHLDDLVVHLAADESADEAFADEPAPEGAARPGMAATCLYCVYDPVDGSCEMASAGHPPPVLAAPGTPAEPVKLVPGPVLGNGRLPFEAVSLTLGPGSLLAFHSTALLAGGTGDAFDTRRRLLCRALTDAAQGRSSASQASSLIRRELITAPLDRDVSLLLARIHRLPASSIATWRFSGDPAEVATARQHVQQQLTDWGLQELHFTTELVASELVTNAIRHGGGGDVALRLIHDRTLVCEVGDSSQTQPRLRRARLSDEGGRGLFLVAQMCRRWGSRYTTDGKTIWAEQSLTPD
ncbi:SpoIIE family protein phosphatase [Streptomyces sp. TG1A-8]|uniref:SpoIIE family protein phosphatase n=1 Tax=Streptomyces sp. TG1A-8 TaxID=3051385 RepID=UPI00265B8248|nr:SpoIIE family protein phosphatase [Streptomyces sp. TG1A-8]MDO0924407.1 SpoIIE family protein phosphatase [Streptomyces sp. TG1A-8]